MSGVRGTQELKLVVCVVGIYSCYLLYGIFQESLYKVQPDGTKFANTAFTLTTQCAINGAIAAIGVLLRPAISGLRPVEGDSDKVAKPKGLRTRLRDVLPQPDTAVTAFVYVMAMYLSNEALMYVSYPTQALAKSCKMIPVLLGRVLYLGHRYGWAKYLCVSLMTVGIAMFQMTGSKRKSSGGVAEIPDSWIAEWLGAETWGMTLLGLSLCLDGVTGPMQEKLTKVHHLTNMQQMLVNNVWALVYMVVLSAYFGQINSSIAYLSEHPDTLRALMWFSLASAFGQIFIFYTIRTFDSLVLSTITTTRKFFTIVASVVVHGNVLNTNQWIAVAVVFAGLTLETVENERSKRNKKVEPAPVTSPASIASEGHRSPSPVESEADGAISLSGKAASGGRGVRRT